MPLDFHRLDNNEFLFGLGDIKFNHLTEIFEKFFQRTGLVIDQYGDLKLSVENQQIIIKIIDLYIETTDLNIDKLKTSTILELKGILKFLIDKKIDLELLGD